MDGIIEGSLSHPSMTKAIMMGLWVEPRIMDTSQSNRGTRGHHIPYPRICPHTLGSLRYTSCKVDHSISSGRIVNPVKKLKIAIIANITTPKPD